MDNFVAEIRMFAGNFAPSGWALCNGQLLPLSQNTALFSLLGTTYGGDGTTTFALPDLQGQVPLQPGQGPGLSLYDLGETSGVTQVSLLSSEMAAHTHPAVGKDVAGTLGDPTGAEWAQSNPGRGRPPLASYESQLGAAQSSDIAVGVAGGSLPHNNMSPYLTVTFIIGLQGIYPPRS